MIRHETRVRVRYRDTDQMGVVYHGVYLEYFETGRTEMLRDVGLPYAALEETGVLLPVLEASIILKKPARYDDLLVVVSFMHQRPTARFRVDYEIYRDGDLLVTGHTAHAFADAATFRPVRPPAAFIEAIDREMQGERVRQSR